MKEPSFFKERVYPIVFMVFLTVVFISAISSIFLATESVVKENETIFLKRAVLFSAGIPVPAENDQINQVYDSSVKQYTIDGKPSVFVINRNNTKSYAFRISGPGLWGEITALIGYGKDLKTMTGIDFIKQNETPGLGARIEEDWYKEQFRGKSPPFKVVAEGTKTAPNEIDGITGATYTSNYVRDMVNSSPDKAAAMLKEVL